MQVQRRPGTAKPIDSRLLFLSCPGLALGVIASTGGLAGRVLLAQGCSNLACVQLLEPRGYQMPLHAQKNAPVWG